MIFFDDAELSAAHGGLHPFVHNGVQFPVRTEEARPDPIDTDATIERSHTLFLHQQDRRAIPALGR